MLIFVTGNSNTIKTFIIMEILDIANKIGLSTFNRCVSFYGKLGKNNIRVSDHLPKIHNLLDYSGTLIDDDGVVKIIFVVISDDVTSSFDTDELEDEIVEVLSDELEKEVEVLFYIDNEFNEIYFDSLKNRI